MKFLSIYDFLNLHKTNKNPLLFIYALEKSLCLQYNQKLTNFIKLVSVQLDMKAIVYKASPLKYLFVRALSKKFPSLIYSIFSLANIKDIPDPKLLGEDWVKIRTSMSGICGSDLGALNAHESFYLEPYVSKEFVLGHENVGIISEIGKSVRNFKIGDRVTAFPFLACKQRGVKEMCRYCKEGRYSLCENVNEGNLSRGLSIGLNKDTSGGWSEFFLAHESQLVKLPKEISDEEAVMLDSFSCALHAVLNNPPRESDLVLVYGSGTMGINTIMSLRALGYKNKIVAVYSRGFQAEKAKKSGADILIKGRGDVYKKISEITGARIYPVTIGKPAMEGGVDVVYDCVGNSETMNNSLRFLRGKGRYVMVATAGEIKSLDVAPVWFRELSIIGTCEQAFEDVKSSLTPSVYDRWHARPSGSVSSLWSTFYSTNDNHHSKNSGILRLR